MPAYATMTMPSARQLDTKKLPPDFFGDQLSVFRRLKERVLAKRPVLADILLKHGDKSLYDYAQDYFDVNIGPGLPARQDKFLNIFRKQVERLLGTEVAASAATQLKKYYFVSTADHHGPICDPYFLSSNLVTAISMMERRDEVLQNVIVLSCGSISVDNDTFPRGLTISTSVSNAIHQERLAFFSSHERPAAICALRPYGTAEIAKMKNSISALLQAGQVSHGIANKIDAVIDEVYNESEALQCKSYSDQITKTNFRLWKKMFESSGVTPPNLIYVEMESLVGALLIDQHLFSDTVISRILFGESYYPLMLKYFDNIMGAFSVNKKWGTYLFWATPPGQRYRLQLEKRESQLVSTDGTYKVELTPEAIRQALEKKEIIPSLLLDCLVLSFYYGLKCLGGFCQVNYLTEMKESYIKMLHEIGGNESEIALSSRVQTKELGEDLTIAFVKNSGGKVALATGLDLVLYGNANTFQCLAERAKVITLTEAIDPMMPSFYRVIYSGPDRDASLVELRSQDIARLTQLYEKFEPSCILS